MSDEYEYDDSEFLEDADRAYEELLARNRGGRATTSPAAHPACR